MKFSENLRKVRKEAGKTQKQVAENIGIKEEQYRKYELGKQKPGLDVIVSLSDYFRVSLDYLIRGKEFNEAISDINA